MRPKIVEAVFQRAYHGGKKTLAELELRLGLTFGQNDSILARNYGAVTPQAGALDAPSSASQDNYTGILTQLPHDVLVHMAAYLDVRSLVLLASTCKYMQVLLQEKTVWLDALESTMLRRPVPLSYRNLVSRSKAAEIPLGDIRSAVVHATRLEHNWSKPEITTTRHKKISVDLEEGDLIIWVWNLDVDRYTMIMTRYGWFICLFNGTDKKFAFRIEQSIYCWDFDLDLEGITIVVNNGDRYGDYMDVFRIDLGEHTCNHVQRVKVLGHVRSNILEDEIAGCVISSWGIGTMKLYMLNWKTGKSVVIETGLPSTINLSASTTKKHMLLWYEEMKQAHAWTYSFEFLKDCLDQAPESEEAYEVDSAPQNFHLTTFVDQEIPAPRWIHPTTRGMWNGRKSVMSVFHADLDTETSIVYAVVNDGTDQIHTSRTESETAQPASSEPAPNTSSLRIGAKQSSSLSKRNFIYSFPEELTISEDLTGRQLFVFGGSGKHALWVEDRLVEGNLEETIKLATFDHQDSSAEGQVTRNTSIVRWSDDDFDWSTVSHMHLDDNTGVLTCSAGENIWYLYFD